MSGASDALGERFRAAREARGMSVPDVAEQIRIRSLYLAAIEDENWNTIGAPVYVRGFLRTYARFLGLDPEEAVAAFNRTQPLPQTSPARDPEPRRAAPSWAGAALLWGAGTVAVLLIAFVVFTELTMPRRSGLPPVAVASAAPVAASPTVSATSWLRVTVDGNVSMEGTFPAGTSKTFHGNNALVRIGNAGGVEIYVDGKDVGKLGKQGDVVEHAFTL